MANATGLHGVFRRGSTNKDEDKDGKSGGGLRGGVRPGSSSDTKKSASFSPDTRGGGERQVSARSAKKPEWFEGSVLVDLIESINLTPPKKRKTASPCVRIFGPDGLELGRSRQIPDNLFPKFNDDFAFDISVSDNNERQDFLK